MPDPGRRSGHLEHELAGGAFSLARPRRSGRRWRPGPRPARPTRPLTGRRLGAGRRGWGRGWERVRGAVRRVSVSFFLMAAMTSLLSRVSSPGLSGLSPGVFCCLDDHYSMRRRRQANGVFISVTRTSDPSYLAELDPEQVESQLISRLEFRFFRRRPSDSAVTGRQGRPFRVRTSRRLRFPPGVRGLPVEAAVPAARPRPCEHRGAPPGSPALPRATGPRCAPPCAVPASPGPACRARWGGCFGGSRPHT